MTEIGALGDFLGSNPELNPEELFFKYPDFLLEKAEITELPVSLNKIRALNNLTLHKERLFNRGFIFESAIFLNIDDKVYVQRFTEAHEIMEGLHNEILMRESNTWSAKDLENFKKKKENLCDAGAANLLMPLRLFKPLVQDFKITLATTKNLSRICQTSVTATVRQALICDTEPIVFILFQSAWKKDQIVPSLIGQHVLWGESEDWGPPAALRVKRSWKSPKANQKPWNNKSISENTLVHRVFTTGKPGEIHITEEYFDVEPLKGDYKVEAMLVKIKEKPTVMTLVHLDRPS